MKKTWRKRFGMASTRSRLHRAALLMLAFYLLTSILPLANSVAFADEELITFETTQETIASPSTPSTSSFEPTSAVDFPLTVETTHSSDLPNPTAPESEYREDDIVVWNDTMSFALMEAMAFNSPSILANDTVEVRFLIDNVASDGLIPTGIISDVYPPQEGKKFLGAFVVTAQGEDRIAYIGSYTDTDAVIHTYYAFEEDASTGILLKTDQYIKLVYKAEVTVRYAIKLNAIDGEDNLDGGHFAYADSIIAANMGEDVNVRFNATKRLPADGDSYQLVKLYAIFSSGEIVEVELDSTGSGKVTNVQSDFTFYAVVTKVDTYKLIVQSQNRGHVCWAGHGDENNSNPSSPYSVNPALFCSHDANGSRSGTAGATVTAHPGGTIYFVMYSQTGSKWGFQHLLINDVYIDAVTDGNLHTQELNGMTVHFRSLGDAKDSHLKNNSNSTRTKFECWVTNVNDDIRVDFSCESDLRETLTLVKASGIEKVVASSFDRTYRAASFRVEDFWLDIYSGSQLGPGDIGKDLVNEYWQSGARSGFAAHRTSVNGRTAVEALTSTSTNAFFPDNKYGSRYVYFKPQPGYDPTSLMAQITGQSGDLPVGNIADLTSGTSSGLFGWFTTATNPSVAQAKAAGYQYFIYYEGRGINFRNLSLSCDPYVYSATYDLNGGTLNGEDFYLDGQTYTIQNGENRIVLPVTIPVKAGYLFSGWKLVPTNNDPQYAALNIVLNPADRFAITNTTYAYGLHTELKGTGSNQQYVVKDNGNHHFAFVAQWQQEDDQSTPKAKYTVTKYQEVATGTPDAIVFAGKSYLLMGEPVERLGIKGETVIGIPSKAPAGYAFNEQSITRLPDFMANGNTDDALIYYYDRVHSLTISKVLEGAYAIADKVFTVTLSLQDAEGNPVNDDFSCTGSAGRIWGAETGKTSGTLTFQNGQSTLYLKGGEFITIEGIATGSYSVYETVLPGYEVSYRMGDLAETATAPVLVSIQVTDPDELFVMIRNVKLDIPMTGINTGVDMPAVLILLAVIGVVGSVIVIWQRRRFDSEDHT